MAKVAVLGGGISGLATAYYLTRLAGSPFRKIVVLEAGSQLGGWINSKQLPDGSIFEAGPRSIRGVGKAGHNTLELAQELGLEDEVLALPRSHPAAQNRFLYVNGKLCLLPTGPSSIFKTSPPFTKSLFVVGCGEPFRGRKQVQDETVYEFFSRRFNEEVAMYAADPLCKGVFAGNARKLSMKSCFPPLFQMEQEYGSLMMGMVRKPKDKTPESTSSLVQRYKTERWAMWSLRNGLQQLPFALGSYLKKCDNVELHTDSPCMQLHFGDTSISLQYKDKTEKVDHVFSSLPAYALGSLVENQHPTLGKALQSILFATVGVVNMLYDGNVLPLEGFGHLVPSTQPSKILGMLYESSVFPDHNTKAGPSTRMTSMVGGVWFEELFGNPDTMDSSVLAEVTLQAARDQMNITAEPKQVIVNLQKKCIPQYMVGHSNILQEMENYISGRKLPLGLVGASYKGASVNDCIRNAKLLVEQTQGSWSPKG